jgi:hypothetical protein
MTSFRFSSRNNNKEAELTNVINQKNEQIAFLQSTSLANKQALRGATQIIKQMKSSVGFDGSTKGNSTTDQDINLAANLWLQYETKILPTINPVAAVQKDWLYKPINLNLQKAINNILKQQRLPEIDFKKPTTSTSAILFKSLQHR